MSGKIWYSAAEVADTVVNLPYDNSLDTDIEDEDESDIESDLEDIDNLLQPESETETSENESSSESESVEEARTHSSEEEQQPALLNAQNDTQTQDAVVPTLPHYEVNQQRSWTKREKQETIHTFNLLQVPVIDHFADCANEGDYF